MDDELDQAAAPVESDTATDAGSADGEDVEGHSLAIAMGLGRLDRKAPGERSRQAQADEELRPLSKPFPRMRDDRRG